MYASNQAYIINTMQAYIHPCMQASIYIAPSDYETLGKHKPSEMTVPQYMADILRKQAELFRQENKL